MGNGVAHQYGHVQLGIHSQESFWDTTISPFVDTFVIALDTTFAYLNDSVQYALTNDTLRFSRLFIDTSRFATRLGSLQKPALSFESILINFDSAKNSISSVSIFKIESGSENGSPGSPTLSSVTYNFQFHSLIYDETSIYTTDSSYSTHKAFLVETGSDTMYPVWYDYYLYNDLIFTASSVTLSGIFRTTTFSDPPSIVTELTPANNLAIVSSNGSIACSFDVSDHARDLDVYSLLGIREGRFAISPGQTEASFPHLPAGFYFIQLDGSVAKIYIND